MPNAYAMVAVKAEAARRAAGGAAYTPKPFDPAALNPTQSDNNPYHADILDVSRRASLDLWSESIEIVPIRDDQTPY